MQLFFQPTINKNSSVHVFDKEESRHLIKVLRKKIGDQIFITNGNGLLLTGEISEANEKRCSVDIVYVQEKEKNRNYHLHIGIAPTKMNDRLEWFIEKSTEIGIDEITPIICDRSERKVIKLDRLEKVAISAMKQSLQTFLPKINPAIDLRDFIENSSEECRLIAHCENQKRMELKNIPAASNYNILIGPEGDFSLAEIELALQHQYKPLSLGINRLRTETAGIVICQAISMNNS
ncbi:16S rRNA (uracil(1498)-N(3))-methyltransferase [Namhaeicola litoreus]|uniref:Ribosomal RNA small subunit methyltransferase E n=1 Tax=Namhaeicola litoreus TaxID=1052145 RepID=A0ABW3Y4C1_9FLAO